MTDEPWRDEIETLKTLIDANDRLYAERIRATERALDAAHVEIDRRLELLNEHKAEIVSLQGTFMTRSEAETRRQTVTDRFEQARIAVDTRFNAELTPLRTKIDEAREPNWGLIISIISVLIVMGTGLWTVIGLQIANAIEPVKLASEQNKLNINTLAARTTVVETISHGYGQSISDIEMLKRQAGENSDRVGGLRSDVTRQNAALIEIETQFCAADIMRNLTHAEDMRIISILWGKASASGERLPTDNAYYPVICNRPAPITQGPGNNGR